MLGMMVIGGIGCWRFAKSNPVNLLLLLLPGVLGLAVMMAAGRNIWPRFFLYVFGNALLIVVHGVWGLAALLAAIVRDERKREKWLLIMGYGLCLVAFAQSLRMLPPAYRIPKQDLLGALRYVEQRRQAGDRVATVGEASHVYQGFYGTDWDHVESVADLQSLLDSNSRVWVVSIFPVHLQASFPDIKTRLDEQFKRSRSFPATVGGGEIDVSVHEP
jgi:hypothetical protein